MAAITTELRFSLINGLKINDRGPKFSLYPSFRFNFCVFKEALHLLTKKAAMQREKGLKSGVGWECIQKN
jgi:hypothetical protein